jgi:hypothetical protein
MDEAVFRIALAVIRPRRFVSVPSKDALTSLFFFLLMKGRRRVSRVGWDEEDVR